MATNRLTGERLELLKVDVEWWGSLLPFDPARIPTDDDVYFDLGAAGRYVRNAYLNTIFVAPSGGFATVVSGVSPVSSWDLTTKSYVDLAVAGGVGGSISFSGLVDVYSGTWTSGTYVSWDGSEYVPAIPSGTGVGSGPHSLTDAATHTDVNVVNLTSGDLLSWDGSEWINIQTSGRYEETFTATGTHTISHGLGFYPQVTVLDSDNEEIGVAVDHNSVSALQITFNGTITNGFVYCDIGLGLGGSGGAPVSPGGLDAVSRYGSLPPITSGLSQLIVLEGPPDTVYISVQFSDNAWDWLELRVAT